MINKYILISLITIIFTSCTQTKQSMNKNYKVSSNSFFSSSEFTDLNKAIIEISSQLLLNISASKQKNNKFVITTFVNLNNFQETSKFARVISESLIDELHTKKFSLIDYRTQEVLSVDSRGEFTLTRDTSKLRDEIPQSLIIVGTYSLINTNTIVINARIIDNFTSKVISTAKVIYEYEDCRILDICVGSKKAVNQISISEDK
jgi:TolB-like protein